MEAMFVCFSKVLVNVSFCYTVPYFTNTSAILYHSLHTHGSKSSHKVNPFQPSVSFYIEASHALQNKRPIFIQNTTLGCKKRLIYKDTLYSFRGKLIKLWRNVKNWIAFAFPVAYLNFWDNGLKSGRYEK